MQTETKEQLREKIAQQDIKINYQAKQLEEAQETISSQESTISAYEVSLETLQEKLKSADKRAKAQKEDNENCKKQFQELQAKYDMMKHLTGKNIEQLLSELASLALQLQAKS